MRRYTTVGNSSLMLDNSCALLWADLLYGELIKVLTYGRQQKHIIIATYKLIIATYTAMCTSRECTMLMNLNGQTDGQTDGRAMAYSAL